MDGTPRVQEISSLIPEVRLDQRVIYYPVRHHSPACAWHLRQLLLEIRPDHVLIEGPRDASGLIPFLIHPETKLPVAIYTTFVDHQGDGPPQRHGAYYPICEYSPEFVAIETSKKIGAETRFIDLSFPEKIVATSDREPDLASNLQEERHLQRGRWLARAAEKAGVRDADDLWDHLFELDYEQRSTADFMRNVLGYCALSRADSTPEMLEQDGCLAREACMAAEIAGTPGRIVVVTGGFHTVALPNTKPRKPKPVKVKENDALIVLTRYGFDQLDRLNGYGSGMPSPDYYQRIWDGQSPARIIVDVGRECRKKMPEISISDEIAALSQAKRLANLRGHSILSREDLLDGIRSTFIKGSDDIEGVLVLATKRMVLAGTRIGNVPREAGQPPIVHNFREICQRNKIDLEKIGAKTIDLDLYRNKRARELSRFFHALRLLNVPFAEWLAGPDFVMGSNLDRLVESWNYAWSPGTESSLIERAVYGSTIPEAASNLLLHNLETEAGQGRRSDLAARGLLSACQMGLHQLSEALLKKTAEWIGEDSQFESLVTSMESIVVLHISREPLEAQHLEGLLDVASSAYDRACYVLPDLSNVGEAEEKGALNALCAFSQVVRTLGDTVERQELRAKKLNELNALPTGSASISGAALGILFADSQMTSEQLVEQFRGRLMSTANEGKDGPDFLRGLLRTARGILWHVPQILESLNTILREWEEEHFIRQLPHLRLALSDLTPTECDRLAETISDQTGTEFVLTSTSADFGEQDMLRGVEINQLVRKSLTRDGLEEYVG